MSSKMARAVRKILSAWGTRLPSRVMQPMQKAMSVAIGMPQPARPGPWTLKARKMADGTSMPPTAAIAGRMARRNVRSSPTTSSRLISIPTSRKKIAISPSLMTCWRLTCPPRPPTPSESEVDRSRW